MRVTAKADYAVRACVELAAAGDAVVPVEQLAASQGLPVRFLERILTDLRRSGVVATTRGRGGGHRLARPAAEVTLAQVIRAVDGPLVVVRDERPPDLEYEGSAASLQLVWVALRASVRQVLDRTTVGDLVAGTLPQDVRALADRADAWGDPAPPNG